jgi:hypothetical protein
MVVTKVLYLPNLGMVIQRQTLLVDLGTYHAANASVDNGHVLEVKRGTVVFVSANLAREFAGVVGVVKVPELVGRQGEAFVAEKATVVFAKLCEIAQEGCMITAARARGVIIILGRIALSAFEGGIVLGALVGRIALGALIHRDGFTVCCY